MLTKKRNFALSNVKDRGLILTIPKLSWDNNPKEVKACNFLISSWQYTCMNFPLQ